MSTHINSIDLETNKKIILIEGPDAAGKTSLNNAINELTKSAYIHITKPINNTLRAYNNMYNNTLKAAKLIQDTGQYVVLDRYLISNIIYDMIFEGVLRQNESALDKMLSEVKIIYYALPTDKNKYLQKFAEMQKQREELYNNMSRIYDAFYNLYFGIYDDICCKHSWFNKIVLQGGLQKYKNVILYDMQQLPLDKLKDWVTSTVLVK